MKNKNKIKLFLTLLIIIGVTTPTAHATVLIKSNYYNSEAHIQETIITKNSNYRERTLVTPYSGFKNLPKSIISIGNGESYDKMFEIYYKGIISNGNKINNIQIKTKTDSGKAKWMKSLMSSFGDTSIKAGIKYESDGQLDMSYKNNELEINEKISNKNTTYSGEAVVSNNKITSSGTLTSKNNSFRGFSITTNVKNMEKNTTMRAEFNENEDLRDRVTFECKNGAEIFDEGGKIDKLIKINAEKGFGIITDEKSSIRTSMNFEAYTNNNEVIPPQSVPPNGELQVKIIPLNNSNLNIEQELDLKMSVKIWK